jgi:hypothetical protein
MSEAQLCGKDVSSFIGGDSPFTDVTFIKYDDGPTSGVVRCRSSSETYRFEILARDFDGKYDWQAWDQGEEIRIFSLAALSELSYQRFLDVLSQPASRQKLAEDEAYFNEVYSILEEASPPKLIIATHGINTGIIAAQEVSSAEIAGVRDWFSFLGFSASAKDEL